MLAVSILLGPEVSSNNLLTNSILNIFSFEEKLDNDISSLFFIGFNL